MPISKIKENGYDLSISRNKETEYEEIRYEKPEVIIAKIETLENEIQNSLKDLKTLLKNNQVVSHSPLFLLLSLHRAARPDRG